MNPTPSSPSRLAAFLISLSASFLLFGYEFIRSPSTTLFKQYYGPENLPYAMAMLPVLLMATLWVYGKTLSRVGARKTLWLSSLCSAVLLWACWWGLSMEWGWASVVLYGVREVYVVLLIEQYWSFLNSKLSTQEAKVLNGPIIGLTSLGGALAGYLIGEWATVYGTVSLLHWGAASILPAALVSDYAYHRLGEPVAPPVSRPKALGTSLGLGEFKSHPLLILILVIVITSQVVSTLHGLNFQTALTEALPDSDEQTAFSGRFFSVLLLLSAFFQFVATPLAFKFFKVTTLLWMIPLIHLAMSLGAFLSPGLLTTGAAYLVFKVFDYSIFRAAKETLYIPLSFDIRYRAKEIVDVFGYRVGKGGTSILILLLTPLLKYLGVVLSLFYAIAAIGSSLVWFGVSWKMKKDPDTTRVKLK